MFLTCSQGWELQDQSRKTELQTVGHDARLAKQVSIIHWRASYAHTALCTQPEVTENFSAGGDMMRAVLLNYFLLKAALSYTLSTYRSSEQKRDIDSLFHVQSSQKQNAIAHQGHASHGFFVIIVAVFHMFLDETEVPFHLLCLDYLEFPEPFFPLCLLGKSLCSQAAQLVNSLMAK